MSEAKDPAIKLFGKTIHFPEKSPKAAAATTSFSATCGDDKNNNNSIDEDHDRCCSSNSSSEENKGEEREDQKVRILGILKNTHCLEHGNEKCFGS